MIWKVNYTEDAEQDLQSIFDYISDVLLEPVTATQIVGADYRIVAAVDAYGMLDLTGRWLDLTGRW